MSAGDRQPPRLLRLEASDPRPEFTSGDPDLDEFFHKDSVASCDELMAVTYVLMKDERATGFFCVSNDSIRRQEVEKNILRKLLSPIPFEKRYSSLPAAKIGRLGVAKDFQSSGIGTEILDYLKYWFTHGNKTGCRFLVVDAYNKPRVINFYRKNGFQFLASDDEQDETRIMYFDLILFVRAARASASS